MKYRFIFNVNKLLQTCLFTSVNDLQLETCETMFVSEGTPLLLIKLS